jgi:hypothetical protein
MNEHSFSEGSGSGVLLVVAVKIIVEKFIIIFHRNTFWKKTTTT